VYNSAFMNMLRDEDNAKYRSVIKNTLEFDPQVLKRYVNFMNNPDEDTAINQFGKGDKYFGICTLLATMPGLPMFGHGQIEGLSEKYGMEYRRAYWNESPDRDLVRKHEREVAPLLHRRRVFAEVDDFLLYDFYAPQGTVNEDVFAYSNRSGDSRGLVIYHNRFADTRGTIRVSAAFADRGTLEAEGRSAPTALRQRTLADGLGLSDDPHAFTIFRDHVSGLEYIRNNRRLHEEGLYVELGAYQRHVFIDFRQVHGPPGSPYHLLAERLHGRGVESLEGALRTIALRPLHDRFDAVADPALWRDLIACAATGQGSQEDEPEETCARLLDRVEGLARDFLTEASRQAIAEDGQADPSAVEGVTRELVRELKLIWRLPAALQALHETSSAGAAGPQDTTTMMGTLLSWLFLHPLAKLLVEGESTAKGQSWFDGLALHEPIMDALRSLGLDSGAAVHAVLTLRVVTRHQGWLQGARLDSPNAYRALHSWLSDDDVRRLIGVHEHRDTLWFSKEAFDDMIWWMAVTEAIAGATPDTHQEGLETQLTAALAIVDSLRLAAAEAGYRMDRLLKATEIDLS
jgi:hypothetical protein